MTLPLAGRYGPRGGGVTQTDRLGSEVDGVRLMSEAGVNRILEEQTNGLDRVMQAPTRFGAFTPAAARVSRLLDDSHRTGVGPDSV